MIRRLGIKYGLYVLFSSSFSGIDLLALNRAEMSIEVFLDQSPYAKLLKELICMADSIGLLKHTKADDEQRFIEDSILGKMVRINRLLPSVNAPIIPPEDVDYLCYWLDLAQREDLSCLLSEELSALDKAFKSYFFCDEEA